MAYTPDPTDPTQPVDTQFASTAAPEFRALKAYLQTLVGGSFTVNAGQRNLIRNPNFRLNQRALASVSAGGQYLADGWKLDFALGAGTVTGVSDQANQENGPGSGYIQTTAAQASPAAGHYFAMSQALEGLDIGSLKWGTSNAKPITISFTVQVTIPGVYTVAVRNGTVTRSYCAAVNLVTGVQRVSVTIPGDTTGTWNNFTQVGLQLSFGAGSGTTFTAPAANSWQAGNFLAAPGQVWVPSTNGAFLRLWEVQLEQGAIATPFTCANIADETTRAMRYFETGNAKIAGYGAAAQAFYYEYPFKAIKRVVPVMASTPTLQTNCTGTTDTSPFIDSFAHLCNVTALGSFVSESIWSATADI